MRATWRGGIVLLVGSFLAGAPLGLSSPAFASTKVDKHHTAHTSRRGIDTISNWHSQTKHSLSKNALSKYGKARYARAGYYGGGGLQCVPFARAASGIELKGNAANWWDAAAGVYERGSRPESGSVLNFRANGRMSLGHVAVVSNVLSSREIEIDHANWSGYASKGNVSRHIPVIDVSAANDWSAVRVAMSRAGDFGSVYSTYGFIYDRPDNGIMVASNRSGRRLPNDRAVPGLDEVAEVPMPRVNRPLAYQPASFQLDGPDHSLR